ncbi:sulfite exporter TauE/SafE family protein [Pigmentiphaga aceris]|uniref:Probable membrane transporter protein n=1 Tax=Pigmentiphaga aceris TaxID=1940612 RepID=A0A5C0AZJ4_9BURK|nr:sulfite exporter TauE/SafE family protein [Pigmentiphaga aceris]QEI07116.1 sulfite exporter TauE/SafE family protein [Pigmentiphaga aceris]
MNSFLVIVVLGAVVAGFVQGLSGFAFGLVAMSFWVWVLDPHIAAAMAVFGALTGQILATVTVRRNVEFPLLWPFILGGLVGVPLGVLVLPNINADAFKLGLGLLLLIWCPAMLFIKRPPVLKQPNKLADGVVGMMGGALSALGGFSGVIPTLWTTVRGFPRHSQRAVVQNFNLTMLSVTMISYLLTGVISREMWPMFAIVAPAVLIPSVVGTRLYRSISDTAFRRLVLVLLSASGLAMLVFSLPRVLAN